MLARHRGGKAVPDEGAAYAVDLIGGDGYADARAAEQYAEVVAALLVLGAGRDSHVGIVDPVLHVDAEVDDFVSLGLEPGGELLLKGDGSVIIRYDDSHARIL
jgi:hypothetical protein